MIKIIAPTDLLDLRGIQLGTFTRQGGVSSGRYASLNCAYESKDDPANVTENRRRALQHINRPLNDLITVKNVHGNHVVLVDKYWNQASKPNADGMVTNFSGVVLGSDSADCPIILFADDQSRVIGLAHAGWRGAKQNIIEITVKQMLKLGATAKHIVAIISPCISQDSYEVGLEFYNDFINDDPNNHQYFKPANKIQHAMFDLRKYVYDKLISLGLKRIASIEMDTYVEEDLLYSCRRAFHRGDEDFGGHLSFICLNPS